MVIGIDIDDTITRHPAFFAAITSALTAAGHRVVVITMRIDRATAIADLASMGIVYDALFTFDPGLPEPDYFGWKARLCTNLGVDVFFDDSPDILMRMPSGTQTFLVVNPERHPLERLQEVDDEDDEQLRCRPAVR